MAVVLNSQIVISAVDRASKTMRGIGGSAGDLEKRLDKAGRSSDALYRGLMTAGAAAAMA